MRRALVALLVIAALSPACKRKDDGTAPKARELPALVLRDDTPHLMLTWVDGRGDFHIAMSVAEVPPEGRAAVRVVVTDRDDGAATDLVYVARLDDKKPDGTYAVATMTRGEWEAIAESRRSPKVAAIPRPSGEPPPRPPTPGANPGKVTVIIYGASWCGPCHDAQAHLKRRGVAFIYKDVEEDSGAAREMARKLERAGTRGGSIPVIDVGGRILIGFDPGALDAAVATAGRDGTEMLAEPSLAAVADMLRLIMPTIAQRDLRNRSGEILREAERGTSFVVTVDGRPVAQLGPIPRRRWVPREEAARLLRDAPFDPTLAKDLARHADRTTDKRDPWTRKRA